MGFVQGQSVQYLTLMKHMHELILKSSYTGKISETLHVTAKNLQNKPTVIISSKGSVSAQEQISVRRIEFNKEGPLWQVDTSQLSTTFP